MIKDSIKLFTDGSIRYRFRCYSCGFISGECAIPPIKCGECGRKTMAIYRGDG